MTISLTKEEADAFPIIWRNGTIGLEEGDEWYSIAKSIEEKVNFARMKENMKKVTKHMNITFSPRKRDTR